MLISTLFATIIYTITIGSAQRHTTPWVKQYYEHFFEEVNDTERQDVIEMDEIISNFYSTKSGVMFSGIFTNNSVLQREPQYANLYGTCDTPNTEIILIIKNESSLHLPYENNIETYSTISMNNGDWKIILPNTYKNGGNFTLTVDCELCISLPKTCTIYNITFGDIYLCLGQSNMKLEIEFTFNKYNTLNNITYLNKYSNIRFYTKRTTNASDNISMYVIPREDQLINGKYKWYLGSNIKRVNRFSAVCWYTAQSLIDMYNMSDINFGLIMLASGGSQIEAWIQNDSIESSECVYTNYDCKYGCGQLYNGMVLPFVNMSIKSILWYQGENNVIYEMTNYSNKSSYNCLQKLMIKQYRNLWNNLYLPFGIFELPPGTSEGNPEKMPFFRHSQTGNYGILPNKQMKNVFIAQGYDMGDPWWSFMEAPSDGFYPYNWNTTKWYMGSIHPRSKLQIGKRMAMNLNKFVYNNNNQIWIGPLIKGCELNIYDEIIKIEFNKNILYNEKVIIQPLNLWYNKSLRINNWSAIKLLINNSWINLNGMNVFNIDNNGYILYINISNGIKNGNEIIEGISYAWSEFPCCGDLNQHKYPCPINMCPIITSKSKLPAIPFQAKIINNKCQCFHPQICDGSDYIIPEINNNKFSRIIPTPEPTLRPTRSPTIDTWIFDECNVIIQQNNITIHFKYSHKHMDIILSKPMITFIVNDLEIISTYNEIEYINLSKDEINSAIKNNKFESRLSFKDNYGYNINQKKIKCLYMTQSPTVLISSDNLTSVQPTIAPNIETIFINNKEMNDNNIKHWNVNIDFDDSFTVFSVFMLCILINIGVIGCYYYIKKRI